MRLPCPGGRRKAHAARHRIRPRDRKPARRARLANFLDLRARSPADAQRLLPALGPGRSHLDVKPRQAVSVDLAARMRRGLTGGARAVIVLLNGDSQPYRVLVWDPAAP